MAKFNFSKMDTLRYGIGILVAASGLISAVIGTVDEKQEKRIKELEKQVADLSKNQVVLTIKD